MEEQKPISFSKWQQRKGETSWWEAPVAIELEKYNECINMAANEIAKVLAYKLFESGSALAPPEVDTFKFLLSHMIAVNGNIKTVYECLPEQYLFMAYNNWEREYYARERWENKSLWQYIKYWWDRKWIKIK